MALGTQITGVRGRITIPLAAGSFSASPVSATGEVAIAHVTRWTLSIRQEMLPNDTFDTLTNSRKIVGGLYDATGTAEGYLDSANVVKIADLQLEDALPTAGFNLYTRVMTAPEAAADIGYKFSGIISNVRLDVPKTGQATFSLDFESSGEILNADAIT